MNRSRDYRDFIVPIFRGTEAGIGKFLGTGSFVAHGKRRVLVTANHVVSDSEVELVIQIPPRTYRPPGLAAWNIEVFGARVVDRNPAADIALLEVAAYFPRDALALAKDSEINTFELVCCLEYSTTEEGEGGTILSPATRIGNVTRIFKNLNRPTIPTKAQESALEVSFPALAGASGAPIIPQNRLTLWGIILSNVDYQLIPVKISAEEDVMYMAPMGIAVHVKHLREMI